MEKMNIDSAEALISRSRYRFPLVKVAVNAAPLKLAPFSKQWGFGLQGSGVVLIVALHGEQQFRSRLLQRYVPYL